MKANSPICASERPIWTAVFSSRPEATAPNVQFVNLPSITTAVSSRMAGR